MESGRFSRDIIQQINTPSYVIDEAKLESNLKILKSVTERTGAKILLALKAFSMYSTFPLIRKYLSGTCASGLYEARLGREEMGMEVHTYSPGFKDDEIEEISRLSDHIIFNSIGQLEKYKDIVKLSNNDIRIGLRVNPGYSEIGIDLYNPCVPNSRLGIPKKNIDFDKLPDYISGLHFHALCEQGAQTLKNVLEHFEKNYSKFFSQIKWVNFGGGHHITRKDYDIDLLCDVINKFKKKYSLQVYLEPGEAVALDAGYLISSVVDIVNNGMEIAILDTSAEAHMPDVLAMPYRPRVIGSYKAGEAAYTYRLGGITCLAGDVIGDYSFEKKLRSGDKIVFEDMAIYSMVKNTTFNGVRLPSIAILKKDSKIKYVKQFSYEDFKRRL